MSAIGQKQTSIHENLPTQTGVSTSRLNLYEEGAVVNETQASIIIELAKEFIEIVQGLDPKWNRAFFRFSIDEASFGSNASYQVESTVTLLNPFSCKTFFSNMNAKGEQLFQLSQKAKGVLLLTIDADFNFDTKFEYDDLARWKISKIDGGTGIPVGI